MPKSRSQDVKRHVGEFQTSPGGRVHNRSPLKDFQGALGTFKDRDERNDALAAERAVNRGQRAPAPTRGTRQDSFRRTEKSGFKNANTQLEKLRKQGDL